jgi:hypothetical protein
MIDILYALKEKWNGIFTVDRYIFAIDVFGLHILLRRILHVSLLINRLVSMYEFMGKI